MTNYSSITDGNANSIASGSSGEMSRYAELPILPAGGAYSQMTQMEESFADPWNTILQTTPKKHEGGGRPGLDAE